MRYMCITGTMPVAFQSAVLARLPKHMAIVPVNVHYPLHVTLPNHNAQLSWQLREQRRSCLGVVARLRFERDRMRFWKEWR
jgi:hypothetical protein